MYEARAIEKFEAEKSRIEDDRVDLESQVNEFRNENQTLRREMEIQSQKKEAQLQEQARIKEEMTRLEQHRGLHICQAALVKWKLKSTTLFESQKCSSLQ